MAVFTIALLQLLPDETEEKNREKGLLWCRSAKAMGADLALFPEMWSCGYDLSGDAQIINKRAIPRDSAFLRAFQEEASSLDMAIAITHLQRWEGPPRNAVTLFDRHGRELFTYAKVHTCDFGDERLLTPGDQFFTASLDTRQGPVQVGAMICYDREFPESARLLMLQGAEVILVPNACPMEINRLSQLRARAFENMVAIATANYPAGKPDCNGHSSAFDGIAYDETAPVSRDTLVVEAGENEGMYLAPIPLDKLRSYRHREVHGNAYRRPRLYGPLTEETVSEPFLRSDRRKESVSG